MMWNARCCCGSLRAEVNAEPIVVAACHCLECQRRTGSAFGMSAYFPQDRVSIHGKSTTYVREGEEGRKVRFHFCPECGTTVYWRADFRPDAVGIAAGAFGDPSFPAPFRSVWERSAHGWVAFRHELEHRQTNQPQPIGA